MSKFCSSKNVPGFAKGLQILLVDNDRECLSVMATMLQLCSYKVTTADQVSQALSMIEEQESRFKLVIVCIDLADMDPISFLKASLQRGIGVIMISSDRNGELAYKALNEGASLFLMKPVPMEVLKQFWQSACWKHTKISEETRNDTNEKSSQPLHLTPPNEDNILSTTMTGTNINKKRARWHSGDDALIDNDDTSSPTDSVIERSHLDGSKRTKPCLIWTPELHNKFKEAVNLLGLEKAQPNKIHREMGVPHLTRHQIASHLQKYKARAKRSSGGKSSVDAAAKSQISQQENPGAYQLEREDLSFIPLSVARPSGGDQRSSPTCPTVALSKAKQPMELDGGRIQNYLLQGNENQFAPSNLGFDFSFWTARDGGQNIDTVVNRTATITTSAVVGSSQENQPISKYVDNDILRFLEEDDDGDHDPNNSGCGPNREDVDRYCEWLRKSI